MRMSSQRAWRQALRTANFIAPAALVALVLTAGPIRADDASADTILRDNTQQVLSGAATVAGAGYLGGSGAPMVVALLQRGDQEHLWKLEASDRALPLDPRLLHRVKDSTGDRIDDSAFEAEAYCEAVYKASLVSLGAFANSAHDATFRELMTRPGFYRGDVIHYEGKLRSVRDFDAPLMLSGKGISTLYECWIFDKDNGANPVCLVCSELPAGVKPAEHLSVPVAFDAYFFKKYGYQAVDSRPGYLRVAPQFIGRSFVVVKQAPVSDPERESFTGSSEMMLTLFLGGVLLTVVLAIGAHLWIKRSDRRVRQRVVQARLPEVADSGPPILPPAEPSANLTEALPGARD